MTEVAEIQRAKPHKEQRNNSGVVKHALTGQLNVTRKRSQKDERQGKTDLSNATGESGHRASERNPADQFA